MRGVFSPRARGHMWPRAVLYLKMVEYPCSVKIDYPTNYDCFLKKNFKNKNEQNKIRKKKLLKNVTEFTEFFLLSSRFVSFFFSFYWNTNLKHFE